MIQIRWFDDARLVPERSKALLLLDRLGRVKIPAPEGA